MSVVVFGSSDDLVEVEGDIEEEFNPSGDGPSFLAFSDGTVLRIAYDGQWHITRVSAGVSLFTHDSASADEGRRKDGSPSYSDRATLAGMSFPMKWVVFGDRISFS